MLLALVGGASAHASAVSSPPPPPPPAPPCTVAMLKQRPAGDKSWPIACSDTTLGTSDTQLDLSGAHLSYGDFTDAAFNAAGAIRLNGTNLAHADLSGLTITATASDNETLIDFEGANLTSANLSGSTITATANGSYAEAEIDFDEANLGNADLSGATITAAAEGEEAEAAVGGERRATQVRASEAGSLQPDCTRSYERGVLEVAIRQVRPAQVELLVRCAERGAGARDRPALVAGGALPEHRHGARRGRRRRRRRHWWARWARRQ